jgi:hypothetical protein
MTIGLIRKNRLFKYTRVINVHKISGKQDFEKIIINQKIKQCIPKRYGRLILNSVFLAEQ